MRDGLRGRGKREENRETPVKCPRDGQKGVECAPFAHVIVNGTRAIIDLPCFLRYRIASEREFSHFRSVHSKDPVCRGGVGFTVAEKKISSTTGSIKSLFFREGVN